MNDFLVSDRLKNLSFFLLHLSLQQLLCFVDLVFPLLRRGRRVIWERKIRTGKGHALGAPGSLVAAIKENERSSLLSHFMVVDSPGQACPLQ